MVLEQSKGNVSATENPYDPQTMAPGSADEARQFIEVYQGTRPSQEQNHPLDFDKFGIPAGFIVVTHRYNRSRDPHIEQLWQFKDRVVAPTIPLVFGGIYSIDPAQRQKLRNEIVKFSKFHIEEAELDAPGVPDFKANPALVMFLDPLGNWQVDAIMISDCLKEVSVLADEIRSLTKKHPSAAEKLRRRMKELVYYLLSGEVYA